MKPCLFKLTLILGCAVMAAPVSAQSSASPRSVAAPKTLSVAANLNTAAFRPATTFTAAGSVIILADGIVANTRVAQVLPPAPGFVYER